MSGRFVAFESAGSMLRMSGSEHAPLVSVVDDDDALRDSLRWLLESAGYRVTVYASAEAFLADDAAGVASCLVLDMRLPGLSGVQLQQHLVRMGYELPVIFITGHGGARAQAEALKSGAASFLQKPFNDEQLLALIEQTVIKTRSRL